MGLSVSPTVYNKTMTNANTEYSQVLPVGTKKFLIKCRTAFDIKLTFTANASGTTYITIPADKALLVDNLSLSGTKTLYFQCATSAKVAEILAWT